MRHRVAGVKLGRTPAHRRALLRNLVTALLEHEVVRTTDAKAKELRRWGDRVITLGKQGTLHARRRAAAGPRPGEWEGRELERSSCARREPRGPWMAQEDAVSSRHSRGLSRVSDRALPRDGRVPITVPEAAGRSFREAIPRPSP